MSDAWYYANQGQRLGPVPLQGLKNTLAAMPNANDVLVWREGFVDWKRAADVPELGSQQSTPPFPESGTSGQARTQPQPPVGGANQLVHLWFGFRGRTNRAKWWLVTIIDIVMITAMVWLTTSAILDGDSASPSLPALLALVVYFVFVVSIVAVASRRLHDRNKPGWWALVFVVGLIVLSYLAMSISLIGFAVLAIFIWAVFELGILRGTVGPNQYGADPLESRT